MNGWQWRDTVASVCVLLAIALAVAMALHLTGCALFQHDEARSAAEIACVERYKTVPQIEACREIVNGITSKYTKDAGYLDAGAD